MPHPDSATPSLDSFVVRIYRIDPVDHRSLIGIVELVDGSGEREAFCDVEELGSILHRHTQAARRRLHPTGRSSRGKTDP